MQTSSFDSSAVVDLINTFKDSAAQIKTDGRPLVSTFEGAGWADQWVGVRQQTGGIFLVPDWSSIGPDGLKDKLSLVDGACKFLLKGGWVYANEYSLVECLAQSWRNKDDGRRRPSIQVCPR